jgi:hypothetical protein
MVLMVQPPRRYCAVTRQIVSVPAGQTMVVFDPAADALIGDDGCRISSMV